MWTFDVDYVILYTTVSNVMFRVTWSSSNVHISYFVRYGRFVKPAVVHDWA